MSSTKFQSAKYLVEKQQRERSEAVAQSTLKKKERTLLLGYFVISLLATLLISGALKMY